MLYIDEKYFTLSSQKSAGSNLSCIQHIISPNSKPPQFLLTTKLQISPKFHQSCILQPSIVVTISSVLFTGALIVSVNVYGLLAGLPFTGTCEDYFPVPVGTILCTKFVK